jgi:prepilin-type N-terminal cleavage/methylation domain-containing protein
MRDRQTGFTLIELLVVVTIIVVLLSLLTPAMDRAIYQAELTVCGANLHSIATGATVYASGSRRFYPHRPGVRDDMAWPTAQIYNGSAEIQGVYNGLWAKANLAVYDDRLLLRTFLRLNSALCDPLTGKIDYETVATDTTAYSTVNLWFGYGFQGQTPMRKLGDRMTWSETDIVKGEPVSWRFDVLASDRDSINITGAAGAPIAGDVQCTHPNADGVGHDYVIENGQYEWGLKFSLSFWDSDAGRGLVDLNFACGDGSVRRHDKVAWNDDEMARVPEANLSPPNAYRVTMPPER